MDMKLGDFICSVINKKVNLEVRLVDYLMGIAPELLSYSKNLKLIDLNKFPKQLKAVIEANPEKWRKAIQPHGHWYRAKVKIEGGAQRCLCSECGHIVTMLADESLNYCPHCGAKMDEPEETQ